MMSDDGSGAMPPNGEMGEAAGSVMMSDDGSGAMPPDGEMGATAGSAMVSDDGSGAMPPDGEMGAVAGNVMTSDDGSETSDAELLSIVGHAMADQGQRQTDLFAQFLRFSEETQRQRYARTRREILSEEGFPPESEGAVPSLTPSSWIPLTPLTCSSASQARRRRSSPSTLPCSARTPHSQTL